MIAPTTSIIITIYFFFFFQAEDGIRDYKVTGVQTCALPISRRADPRQWERRRRYLMAVAVANRQRRVAVRPARLARGIGRASCRGRGEISVGAGLFKKKISLRMRV